VCSTFALWMWLYFGLASEFAIDALRCCVFAGHMRRAQLCQRACAPWRAVCSTVSAEVPCMCILFDIDVLRGVACSTAPGACGKPDFRRLMRL
jgi:hypothetical protein